MFLRVPSPPPVTIMCTFDFCGQSGDGHFPCTSTNKNGHDALLTVFIKGINSGTRMATQL